jgi:hypothetical protein
MHIRDLERTHVYHSPQYPGYTCWCGLSNMPDDSLMCSFTQAAGPFKGRPKAPEEVRRALDWPPEMSELEFQRTGDEYDMTGLDLCNMHLRSEDRGRSWQFVSADPFRTCMNGITGEAETALSDGTLLRGVWGMYLPYDEAPRNGYLQRSADGARTWGEPETIFDDDDYLYWPKRIRELSDGRVLVGGGLIRRRAEHASRRGWFKDITMALFVSGDNGRSWSGPIDTVPQAQKNEDLGLSEEFDWAELDNGDLLLVMRADGHPDGPHRMQTRLVRRGSTWETSAVEEAPFPHSGHPEMLATREGVILHVATTGISWTTDEGGTWRDLELDDGLQEIRGEPAVGYYPKSVQMADGEVFIVGHVGGDDGYGCVDQSIVAVRFFLGG